MFPLRNETIVFVSVKELDLTSTFVSKAADIVRRKSEQKSRTEPKAKKGSAKAKSETVPEKAKEESPVSAGKISEEKSDCLRSNL